MKTLALSSLLVLAASVVNAGEPNDSMVKFIDASVRGWFADTALQDAVRASNAAHDGMSEDDLVALDTTWRAEVGSAATPTISAVMDSPVSQGLLAHVEASQGVITEIIVMDNRGMNVAVSAVTSDFWQGDEAKFQETYPHGADAVHVGEIELDESSQTYQAQVSFVITDSASGAPIGAVTVGLNAEAF